MRLNVIFIISILTLSTIGANSLAFSESGSRAIQPSSTQYGWHLPNTTYPLHYHLLLTTEIHRQVSEYRGNTTIELTVLEDTTEIVLHALQLTISDISIRDLRTNEEYTTCVSFELEPTYQLLIIKCAPNCIEACSFQRYQHLSVTILFEANIGDSEMGFIKMKHDVKNPTTAFGAYTYLEPTHARSVFPCYDEPRLRANFTITIIHGRNYSANSGMPVVSEVPIEGTDLVTTQFATTPLTSTYLVSFIISAPFQSVERSSNGIVHRVLVPATPNVNISQSLIFLNNSIAIVDFIGAYWQQPYPLPKLDHCAVPGLFPAGMENWGLIIFKQNYLINFEKSDKYERMRSLMTQNHEIVHQWFGNLVTINWWPHLWLSEAFATYYSYAFTNKLYPEYEASCRFDAICYNSFDLSENHSVVSHIDTSQEIAPFLKSMMYDRAPCILQMFVHAFGEDVLRKSLTTYLDLYKYGNADTAALTTVIQHTVAQDHLSKNQTWSFDVSEIMQTWLGQKDYPIVLVRRNYTTEKLHITQQSFDAESSSRWWLPLDISAGTKWTTKLYMPAVAAQIVDLSVELNSAEAVWYLINPYGKGYYPVIYDTENWLRLARALQNAPYDFERGMRIAIIRNAWYATRMQLLDNPIILLELLRYLRKETDLIVLRELSELLYDVHNEIFMVSAFDALYGEFMLANLQEVVADIKDLDEMELVELKFYIDDIKKKALVWKDADFEKNLNACLSPATLDVCCWACLQETRNDSNFERLLDVVYNITTGTSSSFCEKQLSYIAHTMVSVHSVDRNVTWTKLAQNFEHILDTAPCELSAFSKALEGRAHRIQPRFLEKVLQAVDIYDRKVPKKSEPTLRSALLRKRQDNHLTRGAGLRHWFFELVPHTDLANFFEEQRAIDTNSVVP